MSWRQRPEAAARLTREREREDAIAATPPDPTGGPWPLAPTRRPCLRCGHDIEEHHRNEDGEGEHCDGLDDQPDPGRAIRACRCDGWYTDAP